MSNTKFTPLEANPESVNLPAYKLKDLNTPEVDYNQENSSRTLSEGEDTSQPTPVTEDALALFNSKKKNEFEKSYSFRIKSSTIEERVYRFNSFPKNGFEGFHKIIEDKIQYSTQSLSPTPFAIGYFDQHNDLITISNDEDLLGCVHWFNIRYHHYLYYDIKLITYDIRNHATVAKQKKRKCILV